MSVLRPGGLELTKYAIEKTAPRPEARLLDVGCGDGTVGLFVRDNFGQSVIGIDTDEVAVSLARQKGLDAHVMDASALDFDVCMFDTVLMECVFSVLERQEEAIHEAYCVLRPGGNLIISDLYCRQPDMERWENDYDASMALFRKPRLHENCGKLEHIPSPYCQDGAVVLMGLTDLLAELELEITLLEDFTDELHSFIAQSVMDSGSLEIWLAGNGSWRGCGCARRDAGYFLLIAHKRENNA